MTPYAPDEPTVVLARLEPPRAWPSTVLLLGRIFDWAAISLMALSVCAFICQQGFGAFHTVKTAAEFPLTVAMAASTHADQQGPGYIEHTTAAGR